MWRAYTAHRMLLLQLYFMQVQRASITMKNRTPLLYVANALMTLYRRVGGVLARRKSMPRAKDFPERIKQLCVRDQGEPENISHQLLFVLEKEETHQV